MIVIYVVILLMTFINLCINKLSNDDHIYELSFMTNMLHQGRQMNHILYTIIKVLI